jgi:hypothetical protein
MAGISFGDAPESVWIVAGWAFRQVVQDLRAYAHGDAAFLDALASAEHIGFLDIESQEPRQRAGMTNAIETMCRGILDGTASSGIEESFPDPETQSAYREGIQLLLNAVQGLQGHQHG